MILFWGARTLSYSGGSTPFFTPSIMGAGVVLSGNAWSNHFYLPVAGTLGALRVSSRAAGTGSGILSFQLSYYFTSQWLAAENAAQPNIAFANLGTALALPAGALLSGSGGGGGAVAAGGWLKLKASISAGGHVTSHRDVVIVCELST